MSTSRHPGYAAPHTLAATSISRRSFAKLFLAGGAALAGMALSGCNLEGVTNSAKSGDAASGTGDAQVTLRVGAQPYALYIPVYVAHELGYLTEELNGVGASYTWDEFKSGPLVNEAVAAGSEDFGFMADLPAINAKASGQDIKIFSGVQYGEKGLAVLVPADSTLSSVADLKGKKVAYTTGSYAQHLLALLLSNAGLTLSDVESVNLSADDQAQALQAKNVDAIVIWEQYISKLTSEGAARVLADGTGVKRGNMITYATTSFAEAHPDVLVAWIKALNRADELLQSDPAKAADAVAKDFGISSDLTQKVIKNFTFSTKLDDDDIKAITDVKDFAVKNGIIKNDVDINELVTTEYLEKVQ